MYLRRKIDDILIQWKKDDNRFPLIIEGSRQVGKTESIRHFADDNYRNFIEINFVEEPKFKAILSNGYKVDEIVKAITLIDPAKRFVDNDTLILFDEIQVFPDIATSLKFFKQDGRFDVICSGSMLGLSYHEIESNSVGYKMNETMYSMDFEEFLWAKGYGNETVDSMLQHMIDIEPFSDLENETYMDLFTDYIILGGMPSVVKSYIEKRNFEGMSFIQNQLIKDYKEDIQKYTEGLDKSKVLAVYEHVPAQLAKENKKFQYSDIRKGARSRDYFGCIEWLRTAGTIMQCECMRYPSLPIKGNTIENVFKLYMSDTGMLIASLDEELQEYIRLHKTLGTFGGGIYENVVAEAFMKQGLPLVYYKKENSTLEEDFFVRTFENLVPVEVKSTNANSKSLRMLINGEQYSDIKYGIKLVKGNVGMNNNIYKFPYYTAFLIKRYLKACSK